MRKSLLLSGVLCAAASALTGPAAAAIMLATYTGSVTTGSDFSNVFGLGVGSLAGQSFVATFTYDTEEGASSSSGDTLDRFGGTESGDYPISPVLSASITLNNITKTFSGSKFGSFGRDTGDSSNHSASGPTANFASMYLLYNAPASFTQEVPLANGIGGGEVQLATTEGPETIFARFQVRTSSLTITTVTPDPIPEPTTWAMMILGFGAVGASTRAARRRALA